MTDTLTDGEKARAVFEYERHTTGSETWHRHWLGPVYTAGMAFVAETCGAHWLLDLVASWQPEIAKKHGALAEFQVWRLDRVWETDHGWEIAAWSDTPGGESMTDLGSPTASTLLASQSIPYSDFPPGMSGFEFYCENGTMLLKGER